MKNLKENLSLQELTEISGGALSVNQERVIAFAMFGLFGLAIYEISRNQSK